MVMRGISAHRPQSKLRRAGMAATTVTPPLVIDNYRWHSELAIISHSWQHLEIRSGFEICAYQWNESVLSIMCFIAARHGRVFTSTGVAWQIIFRTTNQVARKTCNSSSRSFFFKQQSRFFHLFGFATKLIYYYYLMSSENEWVSTLCMF